MLEQIGRWLRFNDLKAAGVVNNWPQLKLLVQTENFPPGRLLSPNCRVWQDGEILAWLESRPVERRQALRGGALTQVEKAAKAAAESSSPSSELPALKPRGRPPKPRPAQAPSSAASSGSGTSMSASPPAE